MKWADQLDCKQEAMLDTLASGPKNAASLVSHSNKRRSLANRT